jgi:hypothetical protein
MRGDKDVPGAHLRMKSVEDQIKTLVKSNAMLQKALYIATGVWLAAKFYFEFLAPHHP